MVEVEASYVAPGVLCEYGASTVLVTSITTVE